MKIGKNLKMLRLASGLTQEELGKKVNLSRANISKYESDDIEPNLATLNMFAKIFGVSIDTVLGIIDESVVVQIGSGNNPASPNKKDPPNEFWESRLFYDKLVEIGAIKQGEYLNEAQINALFEIFKGNGDYIRFIIDKHK